MAISGRTTAGPLLLLAMTLALTSALDCQGAGAVSWSQVWNEGASGVLHLTFPTTVTAWRAAVLFDSPVTRLDTWVARPLRKSDTKYVLKNQSYNGAQTAGNTLDVSFNVYFDGTQPQVVSVRVSGVQLCIAPPSTTAATTAATTAVTTAVTTAATTAATTPSTTSSAPSTAPTTAPSSTTTTGGGDCISQGILTENSVWNTGMSCNLRLPFSSATTSWSVQITFDRPLTQLETWVADATSTDNTVFTLTNKDHNGVQQAGNVLDIAFNAHFTSKATVTSIRLNGVELCISEGGTTTGTTAASTAASTTSAATTPSVATTSAATTAATTSAPSGTTTPATTTLATTTSPSELPYNYNEVLMKSLLFYEAQRSGPLPASNRVPWRGDSALGDGSDNGLDLTGGYYDAGDHVKFGFPMAGMTTVLAWGAIDFADGYAAAGQTAYVMEAIRWATDYFIKCHVSANVFYGQVGNGDIDHAWWGRPEDMTMSRPSYKITASAPGSDLAAETAAALAAASLVFRQTNTTYADLLLTHARQLYTFADTYRGLYHNSITDAAKFYKSWSGYGDELCWAAAWLYKATGEQSYLTAAEQHFQQFGALSQRASEFSWDGKHAGAQVLLYQLTGKSQYGTLVTQFCDWLVSGVPRTPQGQVFLQPWGSLRHAANAALICLQAAEAGLNAATYRQLAKQQINLMLGDAGRSFVVGFGNNPPQRPHHKASSCPESGGCGWNQFNSPDPNPHVLYGALVGGPDANGNYADVRSDYVKNEVTCDYNAGFQSAVAGLLSLHAQGLFPA